MVDVIVNGRYGNVDDGGSDGRLIYVRLIYVILSGGRGEYAVNGGKRLSSFASNEGP